MKKIIYIIGIILFIVIVFIGFKKYRGNAKIINAKITNTKIIEKEKNNKKDELIKNSEGYYNITKEYAKKIMDSNKKITILDVRTKEEYDNGHIKGAILMPYNEISKNISKIVSDKYSIILVYCRSGSRSAVASAKLVELGYTNVMDFGGISTWKYEIEK